MTMNMTMGALPRLHHHHLGKALLSLWQAVSFPTKGPKNLTRGVPSHCNCRHRYLALCKRVCNQLAEMAWLAGH